jgi:hypothetical protein
MSDTTQKYTGWIEKPKYINGELVKAVDVVVDELINKKPKDKIITIAKWKYDDLQVEKLSAIATGSLYYNNWQETLGIVESLKSEVESLKQIVDSEKILTAVANNETQASNDRYASLLSDFQSSITKGVQEAIARVSLQGQVEGLRAQKEVLKTQYDALLAIIESMKEQLRVLQGQIELQQEQFLAQQAALQSQLTGAAATATAAAQGLIPGVNGEFYYKLGRNDGKEWSEKSTWSTTRNGYDASKTQFAKLTVQNLKEKTGELITKVQFILTGDLLTHGPFGFTNAKKTENNKVTNIAQGETKTFLIYAGSNIGGSGSGTPEPDGNGLFNSAKDYKGTIQVMVTYSDGSTEKGDVLNWSIRKNKTG